MKVVGIVAEYNPFHNGHAYQINYIKETLHADYIVAVMSGDFVQRGTPALFSKQDRTKMALTCSVDLVLELPVRVSTSSAEGFASGAVELLHSLGCVDQICFGSECGTIEPFLKIASILVNEPEEYKAALSVFLRQGKSFPEARSLALREYLSDDSLDEFLAAPNNILGIEYCKALLRLNSSIEPVTLTRSGHDYHDTEISENSHPSATAIRQIISTFASGDYTENELKSLLSGQVPSVLQEHVLKLIMENRYIPESDLDLLLHHKLLQAVYENTLEDYLDISPALANRIRNTINAYTGYHAYADLLKTRELTYTRIQRGLLHILLSIKKKDTPSSLVPYARVLGFRKDTSPLLKSVRNSCTVPLLTKLADAHTVLSPEANMTLAENTYVSGIYEMLLCQKRQTPFLHEFQKPIIML